MQFEDFVSSILKKKDRIKEQFHSIFVMWQRSKNFSQSGE